MKYDFISADCHIDLIWLPPDLFTANARADLKERMPYVVESRKGMNGWRKRRQIRPDERHGLGGPPIRPGQIHRSDRMASTGLYEMAAKVFGA